MSRSWLQSNSRPVPVINLHMDLDEGRTARGFVCLGCRGVSENAVYGMASPVEMYVASLDCAECGESLVEFDAFSLRVMRHDGRRWSPAPPSGLPCDRCHEDTTLNEVSVRTVAGIEHLCPPCAGKAIA